jgi:micrococcal nuclease
MEMESGLVIRVIDGDTIEVMTGGQVKKIRLIGIDTPEVDAGDAEQRFWASAATEIVQDRCGGATVLLEKDVSETDRYGRLLRYVYLDDGTMLNEELVEIGVAQPSTYPPDVRYQDRFLAAGELARESSAGFYGPTWTPTPIPTPDATNTPRPTAMPAPTAIVAVPTEIPAIVVVPDTPMLEPTATDVPQTATAQPAPSGAVIVIVAVNKREEYVDIVNRGDVAQNLGGWVLISEKGNQACGLGGVLEAGQSLRIWAMAEDAGMGGYNCGFGTNIWNNSESDPAALYDAAGNLVSRY